MLSEIPIEIPYRRLRLVHKIPPVLNGKSKYILIQKQEQASEMPNDAKHHASENRRAIERSLVTSVRYDVEPRRGSVMIMNKEGLIPRPTLSEAHIVYTLLSPSCASLHTRTLAWCFA